LLQEALQQAFTLLDGVAEYGKLNAGIRPQLHPCSFDDILTEVIIEILPLATQRNRTLTYDLAADDLLVNGDGFLLKRAINNIISNAIKYTPKAGHVHVSTYALDKKAVVCVKDNGIGIAQSEITKIFQPFYQIEQHKQGSGLGLHMVEQIMNQHAGSIELESEIGQGTTVRLLFPIHTP
jgi:signal transduction histidine kinase